MASSDTLSVTTDDGQALQITVERPEAERVIGHLSVGERRFRLLATPEPGADGEPTTWRAEASAIGDETAAGRSLGLGGTNVGYATPEEALEETARLVAARVAHGGPQI